MEFEIWVLALLCCAYFAAGFIDSATGGGGLIAVPSLLMAAIPPELALGTNKLVVALSMPAFLITYARGGFVQWRLAAVGSPKPRPRIALRFAYSGAPSSASQASACA